MVKRFKIGQSATKLLMKRKYTLISDYFKNIDSENKAYWLGFIQADGSIDGPRENQLRIKVQTSDKVILEKLIIDLGYNGPIKEKHNFVYINITSKELTDDLKKLGIVRNKTFKTNYLQLGDFQNHYLRGLFDGDGCACYYIDKKNRHVLCFSIIVNYQTADSIKKFFLDNNVNLRFVDKGKVCELQTTKFDNLVFIYNYIYLNTSLFLGRKKDKFDKYFKHKNDAQRL
jgi:DNA-binding transcriptional regulator WhiA